MTHPRRPDDLGGNALLGPVRLSSTEDLLAAVPFLLGFRPERSIVVVCLDRTRIELVSRIDLPDPQDVHPAATSVRRALARSHADRLVVIGYGRAAAMPLLVDFAQFLGMEVDDVLRVDGHRWWSAYCALARCPRTGHPLIDRDQVLAPLIASCGAPAGSRQDLAAALAPPDAATATPTPEAPDAPEQVAAVLRDLSPEPIEIAYRLLSAQRSAREDGSRPLSAPLAARLLLGLHDVLIRDACALWTDDGALNLWHDLVRSAPVGFAGPAATLLAVCSYQRGDGAMALMALERALADDPQYRLAQLMLQVCTFAIPPSEVSALLALAAQENPLIDALVRTDTAGVLAAVEQITDPSPDPADD